MRSRQTLLNTIVSHSFDPLELADRFCACSNSTQREELISCAGLLGQSSDLLVSAVNIIRERDLNEVALQIWQDVLRIKPESETALENIAGLLLLEGQANDAIFYIQSYIRMSPASSTAHALMGSALASLQRWQEAADELNVSLEINGDEPDVTAAAAKVAWMLNRTDEALNLFNRAIALSPFGPEVRNDLGNFFSYLRQPDQACLAFSEAVRIAPEVPDFHHNLAVSLRELGRSQQALFHARQAIVLDNPSELMVTNMASILNDLERYEETVTLLSGANLFFSDETLDAYCFAYRKLRRHEEVVQTLTSGLTASPNNPNLWLHLGNVQLELGRIEEAESSFEKVIALSPEKGAPHRRKAGICRYSIDNKHLSQMESLAKSSKPWTQDYCDFHFALGKAYDDLRDFERAMRHFNLANSAKRKVTIYDEKAVVDLVTAIVDTFQNPVEPSNAKIEVEQTTPVFVVGMPRSGTTLVEQILASHSCVTGMGELKEFQRLLDDFIFPLRSTNSPTISPDKYEKLGSSYLARIAPLCCGSPCAVDKMPGNFFFLGFICNAMPNSRMIHVRRDPVDTCISIYSKLFTGEQGFSYDLPELGRYYGYYKQITDHWRKILPARNLLEVEYEAIVEDTEREVRRMLGFLELPWEPACLQPHKSGNLVMTASVYQVRQPIYKTSIGKRAGYLPFLEPLVAALNPS